MYSIETEKAPKDTPMALNLKLKPEPALLSPHGRFARSSILSPQPTIPIPAATQTNNNNKASQQTLTREENQAGRMKKQSTQDSNRFRVASSSPDKGGLGSG